MAVPDTYITVDGHEIEQKIMSSEKIKPPKLL